MPGRGRIGVLPAGTPGSLQGPPDLRVLLGAAEEHAREGPQGRTGPGEGDRLGRVKPPDVLVLGVGGTLGEAWLSGFLAGAGQQGGIDFRQSTQLVGTSAGSIVAARLAAGLPPRQPAEAAGPAGQAPPASASHAPAAPERPAWFPPDDSLPAVGAALLAARPGRALARAALLARLPRGRIPLDELRARIAALGPRFDGRLRVVAVDARTGHRVVFGAPGAPHADVSDAVAASCAV